MIGSPLRWRTNARQSSPPLGSSAGSRGTGGLTTESWPHAIVQDRWRLDAPPGAGMLLRSHLGVRMLGMSGSNERQVVQGLPCHESGIHGKADFQIHGI